MIVLDTHAWVWWIAGSDRLSDEARSAIENEPCLGICSISCWEVAMLVSKERLELIVPVEQWVQDTLALPGVELLPLSARAAVRAATDDRFGPEADPADRMIAATAIEHEAPLVTRDRRLIEMSHVETIW